MVINSALLNQILLSILKNVATHNTFTTLPNNKLLYFLIVPLYFIRHPLTNRMHTSLSISLISCEPRRLHCKASNFSSFTNISKGTLTHSKQPSSVIRSVFASAAIPWIQHKSTQWQKHQQTHLHRLCDLRMQFYCFLHNKLSHFSPFFVVLFRGIGKPIKNKVCEISTVPRCESEVSGSS